MSRPRGSLPYCACGREAVTLRTNGDLLCDPCWARDLEQEALAMARPAAMAERMKQLIAKNGADPAAHALVELQAEVNALRALCSIPTSICTHRVREPVPHLGPRCLTCGASSERVKLAVLMQIQIRDKYRLPASPWHCGHDEDLDL